MDKNDRYPEGYWDNTSDYLQQCFILQHNLDYLEFLFQKVIKIEKPVRLVEFGCGSGKMGAKLMPLFPSGSSYCGFDKSIKLISKAYDLWTGSDWQACFNVSDVFQTPFDNESFDVSFVHTVLMHIPQPELALQEMVRVTKKGGLVVSCEANRTAHEALVYIAEVNHQDTIPLELFQILNRGIREKTGVDHNIGIKMPLLMHQAGLKRIQCRQADTVRFLFPPVDSDEKRQLFKAICDEGYGAPRPNAEQRVLWKKNLVGYGVAEHLAEFEIERELEQDFLNKGQSYHTVIPSQLTWSFGWKASD